MNVIQELGYTLELLKKKKGRKKEEELLMGYPVPNLGPKQRHTGNTN